VITFWVEMKVADHNRLPGVLTGGVWCLPVPFAPHTPSCQHPRGDRHKWSSLWVHRHSLT